MPKTRCRDNSVVWRMLGILRRILRNTRLIACGLSSLLLVGTIVLWVRSLGHQEMWRFERFEPQPGWTMPDLAGRGVEHAGYARAIRGRLWLGWGTFAPEREFKPRNQHQRHPISADEAKQNFISLFQPGQRRWGAGIERAWRFAGAGFRHRAEPADPRLGRPRYEGFTLALPFWMLAILFGLWPTLFIARRLLRRPYAQGLCQHCGYDLRATPERCPECGRHS